MKKYKQIEQINYKQLELYYSTFDRAETIPERSLISTGELNNWLYKNRVNIDNLIRKGSLKIFIRFR